jgi:hypothetical protein
LEVVVEKWWVGSRASVGRLTILRWRGRAVLRVRKLEGRSRRWRAKSGAPPALHAERAPGPLSGDSARASRGK